MKKILLALLFTAFAASAATLTDAEIRAGGELRFTMQANPNKTWATGVKARPFSMTGYGK